MYTQADVDAWIKEWMESPEGKAKLKSLGVGIYTPEEMRAIAERLSQDLIGAFLSIQRAAHHAGGEAGFETKGMQIRMLKNNKVRIAIPPSLLRRESLIGVYNDGGEKYRPTGDGIDDIFALFTQGWHASNYVYGAWDDAYAEWGERRFHHNGGNDRSWIRSRKDYPGNPFIATVVNRYMAEYPGLTITYPSAWGD